MVQFRCHQSNKISALIGKFAADSIYITRLTNCNSIKTLIAFSSNLAFVYFKA